MSYINRYSVIVGIHTSWGRGSHEKSLKGLHGGGRGYSKKNYFGKH